jgi:colicin import membrane protein
VAKPEVAKPDIALKEKEKEKIEKERRAVEDKQKETKKLEDAAQAKLRSEYLGRIRDKIKRFIVKPANLQGNEETDFDVVLLPDGNVLGVKLKRPSGNAAYDNAVERAISRAQPLPVPQDPALLKDFRELNLKFKAQE